MATISKYGPLAHLKAGPNEFILHFRGGKASRSGAGIAYWFRPLGASVSQVPIEDCETTFVLRERTRDMQEVSVQCTLTYRVSDPAKAAQRFNFTVSLRSGSWVEKPLERLENVWSLRARDAARQYLSGVPVVDAMTRGPVQIRERMLEGLRADEAVSSMGLALVDVVVDAVAPSPDVQKALEAPAREAIQQAADTAVFERRAAAVEKERAIKQNELETQVELARRQEELIRRQGANALQEAQQEAEAKRARAATDSQLRAMESESVAASVRTRALGDADARRVLAEAETRGEEMRLAAYREASPELIRALAIKDLGANLPDIEHLNITPDVFAEIARRLGERPKA